MKLILYFSWRFATTLQFKEWMLLSTLQNIICSQKGLCYTINIKNKAKQTIIQIYFHIEYLIKVETVQK